MWSITFVSMRYINKIQGEVVYGCGTLSVVISFTIMDLCLPYIMPLVQVSEWVIHALLSMATIVTGVCVLCRIYAIGEETVFVIESDFVHCEVQGGAEERVEPEHVIQHSTPRYQQT